MQWYAVQNTGENHTVEWKLCISNLRARKTLSLCIKIWAWMAHWCISHLECERNWFSETLSCYLAGWFNADFEEIGNKNPTLTASIACFVVMN